jgi:hypothetical protein
LLEQQEKKILEDIEKLQRSLLHSKPAYLQSHNSTVAVAEQIRIQTAEDNSKIQVYEHTDMQSRNNAHHWITGKVLYVANTIGYHIFLK